MGMQNSNIAKLEKTSMKSKNNSNLPNQISQDLGNSNLSYLVDANTMDSYKDYLINDKLGTKNAGKIWADKTVISDASLTLDEETDGVKATITNDSDFLHVYSALGSSTNLVYSEIHPLDVVLLLDVSSSMIKEDTYNEEKGNLEESPAYRAIAEANKMISELMDENDEIFIHDYNRVGVIVYAGGTQVVLPLGHYTKNKGADYLSVTASVVEGSSKYWPRVSSNVVTETGDIYTNQSDYMFADSTYLQGALYQGMNMLANSDKTTYTDRFSTIDRIPVLVTLTDGATNVSSVTSASGVEATTNWWDPLSWAENKDKVILPSRSENPVAWSHFVAKPNGNPFYTPINFDNKESITPRTTSVLLTAGFMKNKVEAHYNEHRAGRDKVTMQGYGIGINVDNLVNNFERHQLHGTIDPKEYIKEDSDSEYTREPYEIIQEYIGGSEPTRELTGLWSGTELSASITFNHPKGDDSKYDVKSIEDVYYNDRYISGDTDDISDIFDQVLKHITMVPLKPIEGTNDAGIADALTYQDQIGKYMEVKDIKNVSLFGKLYEVTKDELKYCVVEADGSVTETTNKPAKYDYTRQYYKIVLQDGDVQNNLSYKTTEEDGTVKYNVTFKLSDIKICVEKRSSSSDDDTSDETLYVNIPRNALPLQVAEVNVDLKGEVLLYVTNLKDYKESTPLRVFYTVGLADDIGTSRKVVNLDSVSQNYISKHTEVDASKKYVTFNSNYFTNRQVGTLFNKKASGTYGNTLVSFSPSKDNNYFTSNKPLVLYEAKANEMSNLEVDLENDMEYEVFKAAHQTVNTVVAEDSNKYYYIVVDYYVPNSPDIHHAALLRQGKEFGTGLGGENVHFGEYLCWYSPKGDTWKDFSNSKPTDPEYNDWVIATRPGGLIIGNLEHNIINKNKNTTNTATLSFASTISETTTGIAEGNNVVIDMYYGNNGKIRVLQNDLSIKKYVSGDMSDKNSEWTIKVKLTPGASQKLNTTYKTINQNNENGTLTLSETQGAYEGTLKIKDQETITIKDLPEGTTYEVSEVEANKNEYVTTTKGDLSGTLNGNNPIVEFYNTKFSYYDFTIEKEVSGKNPDTDMAFNFEIKLVNKDHQPLSETIEYKGTNIDDGTIIFKEKDGTFIGNISLKHNQKVSLRLPYGVEYEVKELNAEKQGYHPTYKNNKGTITSDTIVTIHNDKISIPRTLDNIIKYIIMFGGALGLLVLVLVVYKKKNYNY